MAILLDHRLIAAFGLLGVVLELLGSLYLAYDLLGGPTGPLRTLTEIITYVMVSLVVSVGSYLVLFEIITQFNVRLEATLGRHITFMGVVGLGLGGGIGAGLGYSVSLRARRKKYHAPRKPATHSRRIANAAIIGLVTGLFGNGIYLAVAVFPGTLHTAAQAFFIGILYNFVNGLVFGTLVARLLVRSTTNLHPKHRPTFDWLSIHVGLIAGVIIGILVGFGYWLFFGPDPALGVGGLIGAVLGGIGLGVVIGTAGRIEWWIDHLPQRRMGTFGVALILAGLALDGVQYAVSLFGLPLH